VFGDILSRLDSVYECDRRTDGQSCCSMCCTLHNDVRYNT